MSKQLITGESVASDSEAWRAECEARTVLRFRPISSRQNFIAEVQKKRGDEAAALLKTNMMAIYWHDKNESND